MVNHHSDVFDKSILTHYDVKTLEERTGRPLGNFSLEQVYNAFVKKHEIAEGVNVSSSLVQAKVMQNILDAGKLHGEKWRNIVTIDNLTDEKEEVPISSEADYEVHVGENRPAFSSGGDIQNISFDVSDDDKDRSVWVSARKKTTDRKKFNILSDMSKKGSRRLNKFILDEVSEFMITNAGSTEALGGNDRYTAVTNLAATLDDAGFDQNVAVMTPTDHAQVLQTQVGVGGPMPFITNTMLDKNGQAIRGLKNGEDYMLLGYIPGFKVRQNTNVASNLVVADKGSTHLGKFGDVRIEGWEDVFTALKGFSIAITYEIKTHSKLSAGIGKVTGA